MRRLLLIYSVLFTGLIITSCHRNPYRVDISEIDAEVNIKRFDRDLFSINQDSIQESIGRLYSEYGDFFDVFNVHILNIGPASQRYYPSYLSMFLNDPDNRELFYYTDQVFEDMTSINADIEDFMKHYLYHYPGSLLPDIVTYVSRFNLGLFTVENTIGVGIDQYLGRDCEYYDMLGIPDYLQYNKYPGKIPSDIAYAWATQLYPYNDSLDNVLNTMIHQGLMMFFVDVMLPEIPDSTKIGFSPDQIKWCRNNEKQMWSYLVEHKLLFSSDDLDIRKLTENAPYTQFYTAESPGKAAVWQGWQIVKAYARRNPEMSVSRIMGITDYQKILRESRYNP